MEYIELNEDEHVLKYSPFLFYNSEYETYTFSCDQIKYKEYISFDLTLIESPCNGYFGCQCELECQRERIIFGTIPREKILKIKQFYTDNKIKGLIYSEIEFGVMEHLLSGGVYNPNF